MRRMEWALPLVVALMLASSAHALSHAKFVKSEPAPDAVLSSPPSLVTIWFSEELDTRASTVKVFDALGAQVDLNNVKVNLDDRKQLSIGLKPLSNGTYTVKWHAVSDDDKGETDGDFIFSINTQATPTVLAPSAPTAAATPQSTLSPTVVPSVTPSITPSATSTVAPSLLLVLAAALVLGACVFVALRRK